MSTNTITSIPSDRVEFFKNHFENGLVFFDLETTGLSPLCDKIIEFGAVKITQDGVESVNFLIDPKVSITPENQKIHGITNEMLKRGVSYFEAGERISKFLSNHSIVAHNSIFDFGFILSLFTETRHEIGSHDVYCSCQLSRKINKGLDSHKLSFLAQTFEFDIKSHHRALDDSVACLEIFYQTLKKESDPKKSKAKGLLFKSEEFKKNLDEPNQFNEKLKQLPDLVSKRLDFYIRYSGGTQKNEFRKVKGLSLLRRPSGNVLYALCYKTKLHKYYKLKKITEVKKLSEMKK